MSEDARSDAVQLEQSEQSATIALDENKELGMGGFSRIFEGTCRIKVAVKQTPEENYKVNEEDALKKLNHPNVVKLFAVGIINQFKCCALEFCHASMDQLFKGSEEQKKYLDKMPPDKDVCLQLAEGLAYIHQMKFIHRDLKPYNVLIWVYSTRTVSMKWADFEDCKEVDENGCYIFTDDKKSIGGTPNWRAPEIVKILFDSNEQEPKPHVGTVKSDVFSQGLVFGYYILGRLDLNYFDKEKTKPYYLDENIEKLIRESNLHSNLNDEKKDHCMYKIIMEMLEKDPANRISSADVVTKITNIDRVRIERKTESAGYCTFI